MLILDSHSHSIINRNCSTFYSSSIAVVLMSLIEMSALFFHDVTETLHANKFY